MTRRGTALILSCALGACAAAGRAMDLPTGFVDRLVVGGWNQAVGLTFAPDGRAFVWEKRGRVYFVDPGSTTRHLLINIGEEVGDWRDFGMLGFALDPDFENNGHVYLMYAVDYHHLRYFGTGQYNPNANEYFRDTIGRITRYTCNAGDGFRSVDYASRRVLVGESMSTGFPLCHQSHGIGTLVFGEDGTLLAGCGDGASYETVDVGGWQNGSSNTALLDGIITEKEDVGAYRSQLVDSLSGKVVRLDPETGDGVPSNPFYDGAEPRSARSRVWCLGLRNPYRLTLRAGTGDADPGEGDPGTLYIGDVGWYRWEDLHVARTGGLNFGWPAFEGLEQMWDYYWAAPENLDAPNPLADTCDQDFFTFRDLIVQDTLNEPSWPNPCDPGQQVPGTLDRFVHTRPEVEWYHVNGSGPARVGVYDGSGNADEVELGDPDCPVEGQRFGGSCSLGGAWYRGEAYPPAFRDLYFQGDFSAGWIRAFAFDGGERLTAVHRFQTSAGAVVAVAYNPADEAIHYVRIDNFGNAEWRRITFEGNYPPVAVASVTPDHGPMPLEVRFVGEGSYDPEGGDLNYLWYFGDDSAPSQLPNPVHVYDDGSGEPRSYLATLTVFDDNGDMDTASLLVSPNNSPPAVVITSPVDGSTFRPSGDTLVSMGADVTDAEHDETELRCRWQVILHHDEHVHPEPPVLECATTEVITGHGAGGEDSFYYEFNLTVTDAHGLSTSRSVFMYPRECAADFNGDGDVNTLDVLAFLNAWSAGEPRADFDANGEIDTRDVLAFLNAFTTPC